MTDPAHISQDERYRQARAIVDSSLDYWVEKEKPDLFSAFKIFQELANEKYGKSYYPLSRLHHTNRDNKESQDRARHFAQLAFDWCYANRGNLDAELWCDLGKMYYCGHGVSIDYSEALMWYRLAADQGLAEAQASLGALYNLGQGVPQDYEEALRWRRLAADQGCDIAQLSIGYCYCLGQGVPQDDIVAAKWWRLAADQGLAEAQYILGDLHKWGKGVPQDNEASAKWYRLAADQGYEDAQIALINLQHSIFPAHNSQPVE